MGVHLKKGDEKVQGLLARALKEYHLDLADAGLVIAAVMAHAPAPPGEQEEPLEPAIIVHGHPVAAQIKRGQAHERLLGGYHAWIKIDARRWEELSEAQRLALLDHELTHLVLTLEHGAIVRNDDDSPKLKLRPDDWCLTGFQAVAERHGDQALEVIALRELSTAFQLVFEFAERQMPKKGGNTKNAKERARKTQEVLTLQPYERSLRGPNAEDG